MDPGKRHRHAFQRRYRRAGGQIIPTITGIAYVNAEANLLLDERDPLCWGMRTNRLRESLARNLSV